MLQSTETVYCNCRVNYVWKLQIENRSKEKTEYSVIRSGSFLWAMGIQDTLG